MGPVGRSGESALFFAGIHPQRKEDSLWGGFICKNLNKSIHFQELLTQFSASFTHDRAI